MNSYRDRIVPAAALTQAPVAPYARHYTLRLPDGDWLQLPLMPLPPEMTSAIVSLCITEASFELEDRLSSAMTTLARTLTPEIVVGMPTQGLVLAASVARKLGHLHYVPLSYSRKFWFDDALCVELNSVTSPGAPKKVYLDPLLLERLQDRRVVLIEDVISTGTTVLAQLALMAKIGARVVGIVTAMQESRCWKQRLTMTCPEPPPVLSVLRAPLFRSGPDGWMPDPATDPAVEAVHA